MINDNKVISVLNRDNGYVGYKVPDLGIQRNFTPREKKDITFEELRKLSYVPGGKYILEHCLVIEDAEAVAALIGPVEPEYYYTDKEIEKLLIDGTLDQLQDCLDFAPKGTIELVKDLAVKLDIQNLAKREAIRAATGFNVTKAIEINKETEQGKEVEEEKTRRAKPVSMNDEAEKPQVPSGRRTELPKYNIVSK